MLIGDCDAYSSRLSGLRFAQSSVSVGVVFRLALCRSAPVGGGAPSTSYLWTGCAHLIGQARALDKSSQRSANEIMTSTREYRNSTCVGLKSITV